MNNLSKLLILIILIFHSRIVFSQSVDEILKGYSEAIGGKENYDTIQSYHQRVLTFSDGGQYRSEIFFSKPFMFKDIFLKENNDTSAYYIYNGKNLKSNRQYFLSLGPNPYSKRIEEKRMGLLFT
jgi:outer membrane lipoprotein-sorting protein